MEALAGCSGLKNMDPPYIKDGQPVQVFLNSALAGFYSTQAVPDLDDSPVAVGCMVVYTDRDRSSATRITPPEAGYIRLLANDAHLIGGKPLFHGRLVGNHVSTELLRTWIKTCMDHHAVCNQARNMWGKEHLAGPRSLRYIDTQKMCLRHRRWYELADHVALSYVWGGGQGLQLLKSNEKLLFTDGALEAAWHSIPAVIQGAIDLVRDLNTDDGNEPRIFLWVDQLCIIQDDPNDKAIQIGQMSHIYSRSIATLVAAEGAHSNHALSRRDFPTAAIDTLGSEPSGARQIVRNIKGLRLLAAFPDLPESTISSVWRRRAWTMQEAELSHSTMIFTKDQVLFRCAQGVHCEDFVAELTPNMYKGMDETLPKWWNLHYYHRKSAPAPDDNWAETFRLWTDMVEDYTNRRVTYATDILAAFEGISQAFHALCGWKTLNGLIEDVIDYALLWRPAGHLKRRFSRNGNPYQAQQTDKASELCLPTYAWCAWLGPVTYDPLCFEIKSLIEHFEIVGTEEWKRRLVRFSQGRDLSVPATLEPKAPFAPHDNKSTFNELKQSFSFIKPQAQNFAYRWHLSKNHFKPTTDGPWILQFQARCLRLVLSTAIAISKNHTEWEKHYRRAWLLNHQGQKVGMAWYVPIMDQYDNREVDAVLLSKNKSDSESVDGWQFNREVGPWDEWCLCNVMLILRLPERGLSERLTIGKIHERCAEHAWEETIRLV
ncbi:MAG: hypothetical protein Q9218_007258 [Villophora microphyllina]